MIPLVVAISCFGLLLFAGAMHLMRPRDFAGVLRSQGIVPVRLAGAVAAAVSCGEIAVGALGLVATYGFVDSPVPVLVLAGFAYAAYTLYAIILLSKGSIVRCGCSAGDEPVTRVTVARAAVLGTGALAVWLTDASVDASLSGAVEHLVSLCAGLTIAIILWALPGALHDLDSTGDLSTASLLAEQPSELARELPAVSPPRDVLSNVV